MIVGKILMLILILFIMPFCVGFLPSFYIDRRKRRPTTVFVSGVICSLALFQVVAVPVTIFKGDGFPLIVTIYTVVMIIAALGGLIVAYLDIRNYGNPIKYLRQGDTAVTSEEKVEWIIFALLFLFQLFMSFTMMSFDGDDAYYVTQSLLTTETDTLYRIKPYTGLTTSMDLRHALATVPLWIAYIARVTGIHSTIVAHSIIGFLIIPIIYVIYYECAKILFKKERKKVPIFLIFVSIMYIFGNVSIYTNATFLMTRTWQGKSMLANMVLSVVVWLFLAMFETEKLTREWRLGYWLLLFLNCIVAAMCSTASVFLVAALIGIYGVVMTLFRRDFQILLRLIVTCTPLVLYGVIYLLV